MTGSGPTPIGGAAGNPPLSQHLAAAATVIDAELRSRPKLMRFDPDAGIALNESYANYLTTIGRDSIYIARKEGLVNVDRAHVEEAVKRLGMRNKSRFANGYSTIGGLLAGAGLAGGYAMLFTDGPHSAGELVATLGFNIVGWILVTAGLRSN